MLVTIHSKQSTQPSNQLTVQSSSRGPIQLAQESPCPQFFPFPLNLSSPFGGAGFCLLNNQQVLALLLDINYPLSHKTIILNTNSQSNKAPVPKAQAIPLPSIHSSIHLFIHSIPTNWPDHHLHRFASHPPFVLILAPTTRMLFHFHPISSISPLLHFRPHFFNSTTQLPPNKMRN